MMRSKIALMLAFALLLTTGAMAADTVEEIVAANLEAKGGEDAWMALETGRMKGTMRMGGGAAGAVELPFVVEFK